MHRPLNPKCCYHPDPDIDAEILAEAALGARADLSAGLRCHCCPRCGWTHGRGWFDGVDTYRCLRCGIEVSPRNWREVLTDDEIAEMERACDRECIRDDTTRTPTTR